MLPLVSPGAIEVSVSDLDGIRAISGGKERAERA